MSFEASQFEEEQIEHSVDARILKRLLPYIKPYILLVIASLILIGVMTLCELAIPFITKTAIDKYIIPVKQSKERKSPGSKGKNPELVFDLESTGRRKIVQKHPKLFTVKNDQASIAYSRISKLNKQEIHRLRKDDLYGIGMITLLFVGLIAINFLVSFAQRYVMELSGQRIMNDIRISLFSHIQNLPPEFFNKNPLGRLVTRVTNDIQNMNDFFTNFISFMLKDLIMLLGIAALLLYLNWELALISFAVMPLVSWFSIYFARKAREIFRILRIKIAQINSNLSETINGVKTIQLYLQEKNNFDKFRKLNRENYLAGIKQVRIMAVFMPLVEAFSFCTIALIIYFGGYMVLAEALSVGTFVAFISYIRMFFRPIRDLAEKLNLVQNALASAERIFLILKLTQSREIPGHRAIQSREWQEPLYSVVFDRVSFAYEQEYVLQDLSFSLEKGSRIAFVGPTGSGKTSIINLLIGFHSHQHGQILINGRKMQSVDISWLRSKIALIFQDPYIFSGSIRKLIQQGNPSLSDSQILEILQKANCGDVLSRMPSGLDTELKASGGLLSQGERQLLSVARAYARDPELLVLDEATSSVDSENEMKIQEALKRLMMGRSSITIAHRLATSPEVDKIFVLRKGQIIESGDHTELLQKNGFYAKLVQLQNQSMEQSN